MHTLLVTDVLPSPHAAPAARPWHLLSILRDLEATVDVLWLADDTDAARAGRLDLPHARLQAVAAKPGRRIRTDGRGLVPQPDLTAAAAERIERADLVVCVGAPSHVYVRDVMWPMARPPFCLVDLGEPQSARLVTQAKSSMAWMAWKLRAQAETLRDVEATVAHQADVVLVSNMVDLEILAERAADGNLWMIGDGVDPADPDHTPTPDPSCDGVFVAADLRHEAHRRAAAWFAQAVMPMVRQKRERAVMRVIGPRLPRALRAARRQGLLQWTCGELTPDAVRSLAEQCCVCVAPQRQARGAAAMMLHALAVGRPAVCTHTVATTLPMEVGVAPVVADHGHEMAQAVTRLLDDPGESRRRGHAARRLVEQHATWNAQWSRVAALFSDLVQSRTPQLTSDARRPGATRAVPAAAGR